MHDEKYVMRLSSVVESFTGESHVDVKSTLMPAVVCVRLLIANGALQGGQ